ESLVQNSTVHWRETWHHAKVGPENLAHPSQVVVTYSFDRRPSSQAQLGYPVQAAVHFFGNGLGLSLQGRSLLRSISRRREWNSALNPERSHTNQRSAKIIDGRSCPRSATIGLR